MADNFYQDNDDLRFQLERAFDWSEIVALFERDYTDEEGFADEAEAREFYRDILENVGKFVASEVAPRAMDNDKVEPKLVDGEVVIGESMQEIFDGFSEMGLYALNLPRELGGFNGPMVLYMTIAEMLARADVSMVGHYGFHGGIAMSLLSYALTEGSIKHEGGAIVETRFDEAIAEIAEGEAFGCMVLTESDAGSDLGAIRTKGVLGDDGVWRVTGQKIFITSGQGKHQLVLAKTEDTGNGLKDLSLFLVPRTIERDGETVHNVEIERLEEKLGIHASVTCTLAYDDSVAELIGNRGQGFELMLLLMNNARLGVGFEAIGLSEAALRAAKEYAAERVSMGKTIDHHEMVAEYIHRMETEVAALRAMAFDAAHAVELYTRLDVKLKLNPPGAEEERQALMRRIKKIKRRARDLTPLLKYLACERCVEICRMALQIHGGVGYTKDYPVEKYLRDALVLPIYEGTSQIQALMALKDQLGGALKDPGGFVRRAAETRVRSLSAKDPLERDVAKLKTRVNGAMQHIITRIAKDKWHHVSSKKWSQWGKAFSRWNPKTDFAFGMLHAERLCAMLAMVETADILARQAKAFPERRELAESYVELMAPQIEKLHFEVLHQGDRVLNKLTQTEEQAEIESA